MFTFYGQKKLIDKIQYKIPPGLLVIKNKMMKTERRHSYFHQFTNNKKMCLMMLWPKNFKLSTYSRQEFDWI